MTDVSAVADAPDAAGVAEMSTADLMELGRELRQVIYEHDRTRGPVSAISTARGAPVALDRTITVRNPLVRRLVQDVERAGGTVSKDATGHILVTFGKQRIRISHTPRGDRPVKNDRTRLRRMGLDV